jgi:membrane fusion protein, heavy metal efflux system
MTVLIFCCQRSQTAEEAHGHPHEPESEKLAYTIYSDKTELFVEFKPLVVGQSSRFAAHFTKLGNTFTALDQGSITLSLIVDNKGIRTTSDEPSNPGIFRLALIPTVPGTGKLVFDIRTKDYTDRIIIDSVNIFQDAKSAQSLNVSNPESGVISFLKEQAWKIEFSHQELKPQTFHEVIRVSGQLLAKPTDEQIVTARSNGVVKWNDKVVAGARVDQGQRLFVLTSGGLAQGNIESQYQAAKADYEKAEADYQRVQPLLADKIISQKDYSEIKNRYEQAKISFETLSRNYSAGGQSINSPMSGFISQTMVSSGEYVQAGQPLALITRSQSLQLRAEVPLRYSNQLPLISEARFRTLHDDQVYSTNDLRGNVLSYGQAIGNTASLLPIYFSLSNNGTLIPGEAVEVYLLSRSIPNALVVPVGALIEEQGNFYVYVQVAGESFEKRLLKLGAQDGSSVQILSGVKPGERVVTKGGYMIKLATQSGAVPAHGHEH